MNRSFLSFGLVVMLAAFALADDAPSAPPKTGQIDLTFTERSPLSTKKELARRLNLKESEMGNDYDLSKCPFKAYIPATTQPSTKLGIFVYLGYKDSTELAYLWNPVLDKSHLIFITPVCHHGTDFPPSIPMWQAYALAFDAVYNLKKQFPIDDKRIYEMSWQDGSTQFAIASSDVFTGAIVAVDYGYYHTLNLSGGRFYPPKITRPPMDFFPAAERHPIFMINVNKNMDNPETEFMLRTAAMKREGFAHIQTAELDPATDLHYPRMLPDWFEQKALPFLDAGDSAPLPGLASAATPGPRPGATRPAGPPVPSDAQRLYSMAKLYIANNRPDLARQKLQQIIDKYPADAIVPKAKELLSQIPDQ